MKPAKKTYVVLCLLVLVVVSCGPVTPMATPTRISSSATPISKLVLPTRTQLPTATATPSPTPQPQSDDYQLQPWTLTDNYYSNLAEKFSQDFYVGFNVDRQTYELVFQAEKLLRDPSSDWRDIAWKIVARNPKGIPLPGMRSGQDLLAFLMEDLLNNEKVKPEELPVIVKSRIQTNWECYRAEIAESPSKRGSYLIVNNLFGDKHDGWIFYTGNCEGTAVYALQNIEDQYRVEKLRDWQALEIPFAGYSLLLDTVGDVNNNGIPEIAINVSYGASGTPPYSGQNLEFYEWDSSSDAFLSDRTEMFEDVCFSFETCDDGWRIETISIQGVHPLIVKELFVTMYDDFGESSVCDFLTIEHTYLWKDGKFIEQKQRLLAPTDERVECQLSWALQVLNRRTDEMARVAEIISKALPNWPATMDEMWGPASKDYFALRLGLVYDFIGKENKALELIQGVAQHPSNPEFDFVPQLASSYLDVRSKSGIVQACQEINLLQNESAYVLDDNVFFRPIEKFREAWGVSASIWMYRVDNLCNDTDVLEVLVKQTKGLQYENIHEWLIEVGLKPVSVEPIYESNILTAWLVSLPTQVVRRSNDGTALERQADEDFWLFAKSPRGFSAKYLGAHNSVNEDGLLLDHLQVAQDDNLVMIQSNDNDFQDVFVLRITPNGEIQSLLNDYVSQAYLNDNTGEITFIDNYSFDTDQPEIVVYEWNASLQQLDERKIGFDFAEVQDEAERQIFQEGDYPRAIVAINEFLIQAPPEPKPMISCYMNDCRYYPDWYRPYMRYLLALTYEMSGEAEQARDTYYALWQDYPDNFFGLAAEHRLTLVTP